jgi:hypothetical protein
VKQAFITKKFSAESHRLIDLVNTILGEYEAMNYKLSLRQLYYQLVARGYIENTQRSYKNLGNLVSDGRQAGLIDWDRIEDRGRGTVANSHWDSPADIVKAAAYSFRLDKWENQPWHVRIMVEKDALSGVLEPVARDLDIPLTANKGYSSSSTMYGIGRYLNYLHTVQYKKILVIYLGDHDPSGIHMTQDVEERLIMYGELQDASDNGEFVVERIALNMDQIEMWNPPPNPAKETDTRFEAYLREYGETSWELDAVRPEDLDALIRDIVSQYRDEELWDEVVEREERQRNRLYEFARTFRS